MAEQDRHARLLLLGANLFVLRSAAHLPLDVVLATTADRLTVELARTARLCVVGRELGSLEVDAAVRGVHSGVPLGGVLSFTESGLLPAARWRERLGLIGTRPQVVAALRNKATMRDRLLGTRLAIPFARVATADQVCALARTVGRGIVVKPLEGVASRGITVLGSGCTWQAADRALVRAGTPALAEERLKGTEVSVETLSRNGEHRVLGVTLKRTDAGTVPEGHIFPAPLPAAEVAEAASSTLEFLDLMGLTEGPAHTELVLTPVGGRIVESHDRPAGGWITELVRTTTGIDMYCEAMAAAGGLPQPPPTPARARYAAVRFFGGPSGVFTGLTGREQALDMPGVLDVLLDKEIGDVLTGTTDSCDDRVGAVLAVGCTGREAEERSRAAALRLRVQTEVEGPA